MLDLKKVYHTQFFHVREKLDWRIPHVCEGIYAVMKPTSIIDVGCARGEYVHYFSTVKNIIAVGIEGSTNARYFTKPGVEIFYLDLRFPVDLKMRFDVAMCLEVAEHLEPKYAHVLVENLTSLADAIVFTAAPPGQEGYGHVNCQEPLYWIQKFDSMGFNLAEGTTDKIKRSWSKIAKERKEMRMYHNNLMVFRRESAYV